MSCPSCNAPNRADAKFCKSCGLRFDQASAPEKKSTMAAAEQPPSMVSAADTREQATPLTSEQFSSSEDAPSELEDIALAETVILSSEQLVAYQNRLRKRNEEEAARAALESPGLSDQGVHPADMPTLIMPLDHAALTQSASATYSDGADMPTVLPNETANSLADAPTVIMPDQQPEMPASFSSSSPLDAASAQTLEDYAAQKEAIQHMSEQFVSHTDTEAPSPAEQPEPISEGNFTPLAVGTLLAGRYEIAQVLTESDEEHTYQFIDHQGYQHCWNCSSTENTEGDDFCMACGASILAVPYTLHEYPAAGQMDAEAAVLQGAIVSSFIEQGRTYAVEQPAQNQSAFPNGVRLVAAGNSDAGDVRRSEPNEDSVLVLQLQRVHESHTAPAGVFIVADGMGGHDYGQVASRMAINLIAERMTRELLGVPLQHERNGEEVAPTHEDDLVGLLRNTVEEANLNLCKKNQHDKTDMGSTLTGFMVVGEHAYIVNVGDSRTYMVRGGQIYRLTTDHSLVGQLVAGGLIEPDDVYTHPQRSQIFRSLGDKPNVQIDVFKQQLQPGDILLSCSDGLWEMIRDPQIEEILNSAPDPHIACAQLIERANMNGGEDNVSAVIVFVR